MEKIKFSIIVPVYNTEQYLERCFNSILNQTYKNYEVIVVNDGSNDESLKIIKKYKEFICINQKNQGLSMARNNGIKKASGDYLIFLDSDDYINTSLLEILSKNIKGEDVIRYQLATFDNNNNEIYYYEKDFEKLSGPKSFLEISRFHFVENASLYAIKRSFWIKRGFNFKKNKLHEDFGIIPEVIFKSHNVSCINFIGNYYYQRSDGIMGTKDYEKEKKKSFDVLEQGIEEINNVKFINCEKKHKDIFNHYIVNSIIQKINALNKSDKEEYRKHIINHNLLNLLLNDTIKRKLKKTYYKFKYKL